MPCYSILSHRCSMDTLQQIPHESHYNETPTPTNQNKRTVQEPSKTHQLLGKQLVQLPDLNDI